MSAARIAVLAPSPILTVTIEPGNDDPDIHYHAGGQGVWVARMAARLGAEVILCSTLSGESGQVLAGLLRAEQLDLRAVAAHGRSGSYIHDRRSGEREELVASDGPRLLRHEADDLYGVALTAGFEADLMMLTGPRPPEALGADFYRRLARDLRTNGKEVIADLTDGALEGALEGGVGLLKMSEGELLAEGLAVGRRPEDIVTALEDLHRRGAANVLVSRAENPSFALLEGRLYEITGPRLEAHDPIGTGDSMFASIGVGLAAGRSMADALRLGAAAGALNVTRRGLGTGSPVDIERMLAHVRVRPG